jgi:hypothetical protein
MDDVEMCDEAQHKTIDLWLIGTLKVEQHAD